MKTVRKRALSLMMAVLVVLTTVFGSYNDVEAVEVPTAESVAEWNYENDSAPTDVDLCATVTASVTPGEVAAGTTVELSCGTENAAIYYNTNGTDSFSPYTEAIAISADTSIYAFASCDGYTDSERVSFSYTIATTGTVEPRESVGTTGTLADSLNDGDVVVVYYENGDADGLVMSNTANGAKLTGVTAVPSDGTLTIPEGAAELTVSIDENGYYSFLNDGKYLTSGATGSSLTFAEAASDYSLWTVNETEGGFYIVNVNAKYGTSNQYIEYYSGFTTYSYRSSNDALYVYDFYRIKAGTPVDKVDTAVTMTAAQWAGNANYEEAAVTTSVNGDLYKTNDMLDTNAAFTAVVSGQEVQPYIKATSSNTASTSYYLGGTGLGSGTDDYMQMAFSSKGYGNMDMSFRLRASNTAAGSFQLQYSTDGVNFTNFTNGTYAYAYTAYGSDGSSSNVSKEGAITDGIAKTSYAPGNYISFQFEVPSGANNADTLYVRLVPGTEAAKSTSTLSSKGVVRIDSVVITGSPIVSDSLCGYVKAEPASGEAAIGSEITLTSSTSDAVIYYTMNGSDAAVYDAANKPVLTELPTVLTAYAKKDGMTDSIVTTYQYTQAQCATVKGTPNGGSVLAGSKVLLNCATEDAKILYAYAEENTEDENLTWNEYTEAITLDTLPTTLKVKAVKDGYLDSAVSTLSYTLKENEKYNIYFGQVHAHTNFSDGSGSVEEAFSYATNVDNLDFLAITDHSNSLDNASNSKLSENVDTDASNEWTLGHTLAEQYTTDDFTCLYGFEMTWSNGLGHINTFNTPGFQSRTQTEYATYTTALQNYYATLQEVPDSISQFNHPGTTFGDFSDFAYYSEANDDLITMIEVGNGEGTIGSSGYFPSYEYYTRALDKGWHVAPTNNQDNHKGKWGDANTARTVVLADSNNEENIYDAMRNYRVYATEDNNLSIYYTLDSYVMGTVLEQDQVGEQVTLNVELSDANQEALGKVEVIVNGGLSIASKNVATNAENVTFEVPSTYSYYYIKVTEADGDIAVTAPVWVGEVEACGINSTYTNTALPVQGEAVDLNVDLYNNESAELTIDSIEFAIDGNVINSVSGEVLTAAGVATVPSNGTVTYAFDYTYEEAGSVTYDITVNATLNGVAKVYKDVLELSYATPSMVANVIIDGTHYNDYVTGYYGGNVGSFVDICASNNIRATIETEEITAEDLANCALLVISAPAKKNGTANTGDYSISHFSDEFIAMVADYVANGGSVILCGIADYQDSTSSQTSTELNKLLTAMGSTMKVNSDEVYDPVNNGGQAYRMYFTNFNETSKYLSGVVTGQQYSAYSGCSVDITNATENDVVEAAEALVTGFDTTYSIDCKTDEGVTISPSSPVYVTAGNVVGLAHQSTKAGGNIFVSGTVFLSDFEIDAEIDNNDSLPYANYNIVNNILDEVKVEIPTSTIAEARQGNIGDVFAVEGYVTSGTDNEYTTFFDTIYIQDDTAGIDIFPYAEAGLAIGTKVRVIGSVDEYQGDRELRVISTEILSDAPYIYAAKEVNTKDAMDYANLGGSLLKTTGTVTRVEYASDGTTVSEFWLADETGAEAAIFIDGYILSGTTGTNQLAAFVKQGAVVSATGILYMHPEGDSDESVPVFRVRNCDDIVLVEAGTEGPVNPGNDGDSEQNGAIIIDTDRIVSQEEAVNTITEAVNNPTISSVEVYTVNRAPELSREMFEAAAENGTSIVIGVTNEANQLMYQWSFNGNDLDASKINGSLDLTISFETDLLSTIMNHTSAREDDFYFSIAYDGQLPGTAAVKIYVGSKFQAGEAVHIYYFNETTGESELLQNVVVDEDGYITCSLSHCSVYIVSTAEVSNVANNNDGNNSSNNNSNSNNSNNSSNNNSGNQTTGTVTTEGNETAVSDLAPDTGDNENVPVSMVILLFGFALLGCSAVAVQKRRKASEGK